MYNAQLDISLILTIECVIIEHHTGVKFYLCCRYLHYDGWANKTTSYTYSETAIHKALMVLNIYLYISRYRYRGICISHQT